MSDMQLAHVAEPSTPGAGTSLVYTDADGRLKLKGASGVVSLASGEDPINYIRNSGFWFAQRQAPATLTTYSNVGGRIITADGWGISNENASTQYRRVDSSGAVETNLLSRFYGEFTKITAAGKLQIMQAIEGSNACQLRGRTVRLQLKMKSVVAASAQWNIAIVALGSGGTLDTITATAAAFFTAQGANGVDPTLGTNLTYIAPTAGKTGDNCTSGTNSYACTVTTSWQRFGGIFTIPANCKNLIVLVYSHNQVTATNGVALAEVGMMEGEEIQDWSPRPVSQELQDCQRYYSKTFNVDTAPAQNIGVNTGEHRWPSMVVGAVASVGNQWQYPVTMRGAGIGGAAVTLTLYNPSAANAQVRDITSAADCSASSANANGERGMYVNTTGNAGTIAGECMGVHISADHEL